MISIKRTVYPHLDKQFSDDELALFYKLTEQELSLVQLSAYGMQQRLTFAMLLKTRQRLGYFPGFTEIPEQVKNYLAKQLDLHKDSPILLKQWENYSRYRRMIRRFLGSRIYDKKSMEQLKKIIMHAAYTMSDPADLLNVAIEYLMKENIELPAFSTLDRFTNHLRFQVHEKLYQQITQGLTAREKLALDALLTLLPDEQTSPFNRLKQSPSFPTLNHLKLWTERLVWLNKILDPNQFLHGIAHTKIRQFAAEASAYNLSDMRGIQNEAKRRTLLLCLLQQAQNDTCDALIEMFLRRIHRTENAAKEELKIIQDKHRELEESLIFVLGQVLEKAKGEEADAIFGQQVREVLQSQGGARSLEEVYEKVSAYHSNNYLILLWGIHAKNRSILFQLLELMDIRSTTQDERLLKALAFVKQHWHAKRDLLPFEIDIRFASQRWVNLIEVRNQKKMMLQRKLLEVCVFIYLARALRSGDVFVVGSQKYADYRMQLLAWKDCEQRLNNYCASVGLAKNADQFVETLRKKLRETIEQVDEKFPSNTELTIDLNGIPHLKRQKIEAAEERMQVFEENIRAKMPERHLLDILKNAEHWTRYTRNFGPPSGSDPKLMDAVRRYLLTVFGYGCNLGASQTARHAPQIINQQMLRRINASHVSVDKLESALNDLINEYVRFELPRFWGRGQAAIADGTHIELRENNLLGDHHIRYGGYGGIAYHHISDNYIALFSHFISCGVWEAVYIFDGLLKNKSAIQPDTIHADTQGQSEPVFGLAHLLGVRLLPRMRTWNDVIFYRPDKQTKYQHIDSLFSDTIDWEIIATHWQDMMQVVLSIQAGKVLPSMLLSKLGTHNIKNKLYCAFRELGRVERTLFLLHYISDLELRKSIQAETVKIESYNDFLDWISFGGPVIKSGDPEEQEKQLKYLNLVANAIMLNNVVDLTDVLNEMIAAGETVTAKLISKISPYMRQHIRRFGQYVLDMEDKPKPLRPKVILLAKEKP